MGLDHLVDNSLPKPQGRVKVHTTKENSHKKGTIQHCRALNTKEYVSGERPLPSGASGEGGRRPGEGMPATLFTIPALTRAPFLEASPYRARASRALCPLPEGEGARPKQSPIWPISRAR